VRRCVLWTAVALAGVAALLLVGVAAAAYRKAPDVVAALRCDPLSFDPGTLPPARVCALLAALGCDLVAMPVAPNAYHVVSQPEANAERVRVIESLVEVACGPPNKESSRS